MVLFFNVYWLNYILRTTGWIIVFLMSHSNDRNVNENKNINRGQFVSLNRYNIKYIINILYNKSYLDFQLLIYNIFDEYQFILQIKKRRKSNGRTIA